MTVIDFEILIIIKRYKTNLALERHQWKKANQTPRSKLSRYEMNVMISQPVEAN
jgi:hypothetical protein